SGELFSLAIDPNACTGCGICTGICPENALEPVAETTAINSQTRRNYLLWEQLPDTPGDTIRRLQHDPDYSSLAATMLSRNFYRSLIGSGEDSAQEEKKIMHIITSLTEAILQPKVIEVVNKIGDYSERLAENVRNKLGDALPAENLEQLSETLKDIGRRKIHLADLMSRSQDGLKGKFIDSGDLQRKTDLLKSLKDLKWSLEEGPSGVGRSRFALVFNGHSMPWARKYPFNPMTQPTLIHEEGSISGDALGLFLGQLRYQIDHFKLLRRADLEVGDRYDPAQHDLSIAELNWSKLSNEEKQLVTPILVVIDRKFLDNNGWGELNRLLSVEYPVKIILLDDLHFAPEDTASLAHVNAFMLGAISLKSAYVFQGGLGEIDHLFDGLMEGMHSPGPALFRIYIKKELDQHNIMAGKDLDRLALDCRALPLLNFNPDRKKDFLRGAIHLEANQHVQEDWVVEKMKLPSGDVLDYAQSWADWAFTQEEWKSHFQLITEVGNWDLVSLYILKNKADREAVTPVIIRLDGEELKYYSVSREVVRVTEISLDYWRTLREMSGRLYEYPQRLQAEVEKEIKHKYEKKLDDQANDFHARLHEQEKIHMQKIKESLKQRLVALSKMSKNKMGN
ncbi:MAG: 4Fe-4S binding protein, partial [Saprospiraceae bacterium]|nr:4Fe-4S binding protein [Saprospiraceae bacterium]